MKFLAISINRGDPSPWIPEESARMADLQARGIVEQTFLKVDYSGAVLIVESDSPELADEALATLPLVREGITTFGLTPIMPAVQ